MNIVIDGKTYEVIIEKKLIKNTYIRVKKDLKIYVSTNKLATNRYIKNLINDNIPSIKRMISVRSKHLEKEEKFFYLGNEYNVVLCNIYNKPTISQNYIYTKKKSDLDKFLNEEANKIFKERLDYNYNIMKDSGIPYPNLKIRKMTRKWGYNKKSDNLVCLNKELIKYSIDDIDYVIIHELCHFLHFDHSRDFWEDVKKYKPNFKENKKNLKE